MQVEVGDENAEKVRSPGEQIQAAALELEIAARTLEGGLSADGGCVSPLVSAIAGAIAAGLHRHAEGLLGLLPALERKAAAKAAAAAPTPAPRPRAAKPAKPPAPAKPQRSNGAEKPAPAAAGDAKPAFP